MKVEELINKLKQFNASADVKLLDDFKIPHDCECRYFHGNNETSCDTLFITFIDSDNENVF